MIQQETQGTVAQNENERLEEQVTPAANTTEALISNDESPPSEKQSSGSRKAFWLAIFMILLFSFLFMTVTSFFLSGRSGGFSYYYTYGFRDGLLHAVRFAAVGVSIFAIGICIFLLVLSCCDKDKSKSNQNRAGPNQV